MSALAQIYSAPRVSRVGERGGSVWRDDGSRGIGGARVRVVQAGRVRVVLRRGRRVWRRESHGHHSEKCELENYKKD